jgi:hypothetical protein
MTDSKQIRYARYSNFYESRHTHMRNNPNTEGKL